VPFWLNDGMICFGANIGGKYGEKYTIRTAEATLILESVLGFFGVLPLT
jgi:hypothetical protein